MLNEIKTALATIKNSVELVRFLASLHTICACDMVVVRRVVDGKTDIEIHDRMASTPATCFTVSVVYDLEVHSSLCAAMVDQGWEVRPRDMDDGLRAFRDNAHKLGLPPRREPGRVATQPSQVESTTDSPPTHRRAVTRYV